MGSMQRPRENSYAELISDQAESIRRTQTMTKVNDLGVGVIYNWNFQMSYSTSQNDTRLKRPSEMSARKENDTVNGEKVTRYKAHFKYVGLSVQLPTKARMDAHLKGSKDGKLLKDVFHTVLMVATKNDFNNGINDSYRNLNPKIAAAQIFNICSFFDLGALESWYITKGAKGSPLSRLASYSENFQGALEAGSSIDGIAGVNTAGGDQGGPLRQPAMIKRGDAEWIVSAYFALYENEPDVLAARRDYYPEFAAKVSQIRKEKSGVDKKIYDMFQYVGNELTTMRSNAIGSYLSGIPFDTIQKIVSGFGLGSLSDNELISGEMTTDKYVKDKKIKSLLSYVSYDMNQFVVSSIASEDGMSTDKRAKIIKELIVAPLLKGSSNITLNIDLDKAFRELGKDFKAKMGYALQDNVLKYKKELQEELNTIAQAQADIQIQKRMYRDLKNRATEFFSKAKEEHKELDIINIDINIAAANQSEINQRVNAAKKVIGNALDNIYDILETAFGVLKD